MFAESSRIIDLFREINDQSFVQWPAYYYDKTNVCNPIGYLNPWEITDKIFIIKKNDDGGQTFETIASRK